MDATLDTTIAQQEYEQLSSRLSTRHSTERFARAGVGLFLALVASGAAGKLFWDTAHKHLWIPVLPGLIAVWLFSYALRNYLAGKRHLAEELAEYERLTALRQSLKLDDPDALLPR